MNRTPTSARRFLGNDLLTLVLSGVLIAVVILPSCVKAHASPSVKRAEYYAANGTKLYLLIRGADRTAPVLLWLHGGPGGAERPLFRYFNGDLEKHFVVVYWDQRGAGRSFDAKADPHCLTIAQHLADLDVVVNNLRQSLGQDKVILVGHSWGAALGVLYAHAYPEKVSALIAVNPLVSMRESQQAQYDFVRAEVTRRHDGKSVTSAA
jgi:pimeloyl-ACP methyl ester carboxylesterase